MKDFLIVDGYNVINAWDSLKEISRESLEEARNILIDQMAEYHSFTGMKVILVFDAYQVKGTQVKSENIKGVEVIFTKEHQTADSYIEKKVEELTKDKRNVIKVVTSDWAEQQAVLGSGAIRVTPREFEIDLEFMKTKLKEKMEKSQKKKGMLSERLDDKVLEILEKWRKEEY
ncbi:MAG: uncharacterized protein PWQ37_830 [Candidatus Petromonas sp.]|nr:uncharacterized protein [Candidatus Petromonas sp.]